MFHYDYKTENTCSQVISLDIDGNTVHNVVFTGGCNGNLKAIGKLLEGADAVHTIEILKGNECGTRGTSCADQLSRAVEQALAGVQ